jgi:hypothetical protein
MVRNELLCNFRDGNVAVKLFLSIFSPVNTFSNQRGLLEPSELWKALKR